MRHFALQTLTWGTVTAAVTSALWLAASEPGWPESRKSSDGDSSLRLPNEPTRAGSPQARDTAADKARPAPRRQAPEPSR